uniref:Uncharacterized protein n=1 Tax=Nelumbo nucifera TaxID=4432 RepID=A0A822YMM7_NELNU|nr:TPA_asm: hypothetical protein HUJ06_009429 [Nelumbo nucifera]
MQLRKEERVKQFQDIQMQIQKISAKIEGNSELEISLSDIIVNENDLSLKKLEEYQVELQRLHEEKVQKNNSYQLQCNYRLGTIDYMYVLVS